MCEANRDPISANAVSYVCISADYEATIDQYVDTSHNAVL